MAPLMVPSGLAPDATSRTIAFWPSDQVPVAARAGAAKARRSAATANGSGFFRILIMGRNIVRRWSRTDQHELAPASFVREASAYRRRWRAFPFAGEVLGSASPWKCLHNPPRRAGVISTGSSSSPCRRCRCRQPVCPHGGVHLRPFRRRRHGHNHQSAGARSDLRRPAGAARHHPGRSGNPPAATGAAHARPSRRTGGDRARFRAAQRPTTIRRTRPCRSAKPSR